MSFKGSKTIMGIIMTELNEMGYEKKDILYVGDREKKDGRSAKIADIDYMGIKQFRKIVG